MFPGEGADGVGLSGIVLDGGTSRLPARRGLVHCLGRPRYPHHRLRDRGCGGSGIWFEQVSGDISGNIITTTAATAMVSFDARGLIVSRNSVAGTSDNGIEILRTAVGDDGTLVADNRIEDIKAGPGGSGQYGNAINAFRAGNVIVRGNRIRNCDYSAVRGNSASNIQIIGNSFSDVREVALYSEFSFEGAVIANNTVTAPQSGSRSAISTKAAASPWSRAISSAIWCRSGRSERAGRRRRHRHLCRGRYAVTGNVIEKATIVRHRRRLGQVPARRHDHRQCDAHSIAGIGVSVRPGAGSALVNDNMISGTPRGAVVGLEHARAVTADLSMEGAQRFAQVVIGTNAVRR